MGKIRIILLRFFIRYGFDCYQNIIEKNDIGGYSLIVADTGNHAVFKWAWIILLGTDRVMYYINAP